MRGRGRGRGSYSYSRGRGAAYRGTHSTGSQHMTRTGSRSNSNQSLDDSNGSEEGVRSPRGLVTSSVGGIDADNDRPAKLRRLSTQPSARDTAAPASSGDGESDELPQYQTASPHDATVDDADVEEDELAEAEDEAQDEKPDFDSDAPQQSQDAESSAPPKRGGWANRRGKRRKGWNLRKINKIANGVPMQTTPLRAEDAPDRPVAGGILDRLPGRRRAAHPDSNIEADLRRQLELKVAYRSVVKALKPILAELARRTADELESSEQAYQKPEAYNDITAELDQRLAQRLATLDAFFEEDKARFEREYQAKRQIVEERCQHLCFDRQDDRLLEAQHEMMTIIREIEMEDDSDATENEDGEILPVLYNKQPPHFQRVKLDRKFYPRGKFFVETDAAWQDLEVRRAFRDAHQSSHGETFVRHPKGLAVYDARKRALATAKYNVILLTDAGKEIEFLAAKKAREESYARAIGFQAILEAAEMHAAMPQTPVAPIHIKRQTPASLNVKPSLENMIFEGDSFKRAPTSPKVRNGQPPGPHDRVGGMPATHHVAQPGVEYHQRMYPDQRPAQSEQAVQGPVNGFRLVQQQQGRAYGHPMYPPPEHAQAAENGQQILPGPPPPASGFIPPFSLAPAGSEKQGKTRKRPGPRAHYAAQDNRQQPLPPFQPQQGWSPFSNSMGPPMYIPDYIKGGEPGQSPADDQSPASGPPTIVAGSPALSQRKRSSKSTPQMGLQPLAPAHNRGPTPEGLPPGRASYDSPLQTSPRETAFPSGHQRSETSTLPPPPGKYESKSQKSQPPPFLQPLQPSPFQQPAPYQGHYYHQQQGYYGSLSGPSGAPPHQQHGQASASVQRDSKVTPEQTSRAPVPGGNPPVLLPHPNRERYFGYNEQRQPPPPPHSMMFRYNQGPPPTPSSTSTSSHRPRSTQQSQPLPPPPPPPPSAVSGPSLLPGPSQFPTFNAVPPPRNGPLPMPRQHPGQRLGSQTLLPATMDPARHSSLSSDQGGRHSRNASREVEGHARHSRSGSSNYPPHPQSAHAPPPPSQLPPHLEQYGSPRARGGENPLQRPGSVQSRPSPLGVPPGFSAPASTPAPLGPPRPPSSSSGPSPAAQHAWPGFAPPSGPPQFAWQKPTHGSSWGPPGPPAMAFGSPSGPSLPPLGGPLPPLRVRGGSDATEAGPRDHSLPPRAVKSEDSAGGIREREGAPSGDTKRGD